MLYLLRLPAIQRHSGTKLGFDRAWRACTELIEVSEATAGWTRAGASLIETYIELVSKQSSRSATASPHPDGMPVEVLVSPQYCLCILLQQSQSSSPVSGIVPSSEHSLTGQSASLTGFTKTLALVLPQVLEVSWT